MKTYVVTGATGQQGRAVIKHLLLASQQGDEQLRIRAMVRNPSSASAQSLVALAPKGIVTLQPFRDYFDFEAFRAASEGGVTGLFLNLVEHPEAGAQARGILDAVVRSDVEREETLKRVVYASSFQCGNRERWDEQPGKGRDELVVEFFRGHYEAENTIRDYPISHTILRPFWIMSNYLSPAADVLYPSLVPSSSSSPSSGGPVLVTSLNPGSCMSYVSEDDIGSFGAAALLDESPNSKFHGAEFDMGRDNLTPEDAVRILSEVSGIEVGLRRRAKLEGKEEEPRDPSPAVAQVQAFERWCNRRERGGGEVNGAALEERFGMRLTTFREYLEGRKDDLVATMTAGED